MSEHITPALVDDICRRAVETDPVSSTAWDSVDPMVQHLMRERAVEFLNDAIPALFAHGWTPPPEAVYPIPF